ncbi:MAG: ABC transporter substrate-binding protein [Intestinibacter sp.]|uniref:ABC transporter substrate-binding protein n=1 Tax=Intestinibacter sp. TaxID=1965304 RepID=UPI002A808814|nr:ABC transporter substrate-binding protein [Intestinibacter sp.]MDY4575425.1 ABC transporter substrate-binding protein [Intestinibacter sp.]
MKKIIKLISIILASMLFVVGCSADTKEESQSEKTITNDSEYINLTMIRPDTINPILNTDKSVSYILNLVYDSLFEFDENYDLQPKLVDSYSVSSDNKSVDINLKSGVKWHNGKSLTASDVKYTYDLIKSKKESAYYDLVSNISSITVSGSRSLTIQFKDNYAFSLETLIFPIVSKDKLSGLKSDDLELPNKNLVGSGAYKIKTYEDRDFMILEPNQDYYDFNEEGNNKEIYVKLVPDTESQVQMVLSLDSDISNVSLANISKFTDNDNFKIEKYQGRKYDYVLFNYENEYLQNLDIRKAISFSIDRSSIIKDAYSDRAKLTNFPLNSTSKYYDNDLKPLSYNTDNAQNYLKKAVLSLEEQKNSKKKEEESKTTDPNAVDDSQDATIDNNKYNSSSDKQSTDDKQDAEDSKETTEETKSFKDVTTAEVKALLKDIKFKIIVNKDNSERVKAANIISNSLEAVGIKTEIKDLTSDEMTNALDSKDYDLALIGCELPAVSDATYILEELGYQDEQLDKYLKKLKEANSEAEIKSIYKDIQKYVKENAVFISFGMLDDYVVLNKRLEGNLKSNDFNIYRSIDSLEVK